LPTSSHPPYRFVLVTASFTPAGAAEFPNDNPALHRGVRWVCEAGRGRARAVWRAPSEGVAAPSADAPIGAGARLHSGAEASPQPPPPAAPPARRCDGPLQLDLDRIVLPHRVEDVPPPPEFIYTPFVSSRGVSAPAPSPRPIHPRPCRVVDARLARLRVQRGWRVDVAPCVDIGSGERRTSRHRGGVVACSARPLPAAEPELQAASA
jgi:hypothetical protein